MTMVALDAPRKKVVPTGSIQARWMVDEGEVAAYLEDARKQPKMQALMGDQAEQRLEDEKSSAEVAAADRVRRGIAKN